MKKNTKPNVKKKVVEDEKLKPLRPTLRIKKRFILFEIENENEKSYNFEFDEFSKNFLNEITLLLGSINISKSGLWILKDKFDEKTQRAIIKVNLKYVEDVLGAIAIINKINEKKVALRVKRVSGTLKGVLKE